MGNVRIKLSSNKTVNNVNRYADIDVTSDGLENTHYDRNAIRSSIRNILTWKPYERILRPEFGNTLWRVVFENINSLSKANIADMVRKMLSAEPRISVKTILIDTDVANQQISVEFSYSIPSLSDAIETYSITIENS